MTLPVDFLVNLCVAIGISSVETARENSTPRTGVDCKARGGSKRPQTMDRTNESHQSNKNPIKQRMSDDVDQLNLIYYH